MRKHRKQGWFSTLILRLLGGCNCGCGKCSSNSCSGKCPHHHECGEETSLADMQVGQQGRVVEVAGGDQDLVNRFADHGLVRGIEVTVHEQALFGGPMLVAVQGTMVALRLQEAKMIRVCRKRA